MMNLFQKIRRPAIAFVHDLTMVPIAWFAAYMLRFNLELPPAPYLASAILVLPAVWALHAAAFWYFGLYRGVWRYASMPDLIRILKAVVFAIGLSAMAVFLLTRMENIPRAVLPLHSVLMILLLGGPRFVYRWFKDHRFTQLSGQRALVVGAGSAGETLVRDLFRASGSPYLPVGFVDDDVGKHGREIYGVRVIGVCERLPDLVKEHSIELVLIATPSATPREVRRIVELCEQVDVPFRILPRFQDLVSGQISVKELRDVRIEDLLGREPVTLDWTAIADNTRAKTVLVTGGGGSIGSELCRQIAKFEPARLVIFERGEFNLYSIELELRERFPTLELVAVLGDVCDRDAVDEVMRTHRPDVVFHAAAYKHVPLLENQVRQAVLNNVVGTQMVATAADRYGCRTFVLISSDKAVNPANIMGITKRIAEIVCQDLSVRSATRFITVRFGNVLGSSGSVVPLFREQIARGGPVTVTHPQVTRYFMTIPEACQLILQASVIGRGGEIYVLDMGEPVKISYLAEQLIRLSGRKPGEDIEIVYTGLRPGEKLFEELFYDTEKLRPTSHSKILLADCRTVEAKVLEGMLAALVKACNDMDSIKMRALLTGLVPEHVSSESYLQSSGGLQ